MAAARYAGPSTARSGETPDAGGGGGNNRRIERFHSQLFVVVILASDEAGDPSAINSPNAAAPIL